MSGMTYDVVVAGVGLAGATLAVALARAGLRVAAVDPQAPASQVAAAFDGRASAVSYAPYRIWRALGVTDRLEQAQPVWGVLAGEGAPAGPTPRLATPAWLGFDAAELDGPAAGESLAWMVENRHARAALAAALAEAGVELFAPAKALGTDADPAGVSLRLEDGSVLRAAVVVAADGGNSALRRAAGIGVAGWRYGEAGLVATVAHERPHEGLARQVFLPSGPLAVLPLTGDRSSLVWTEGPERVAALAALPDAAFASLLARRVGEGLGAFTPEGPRWTHPLELRVAESRIGDRLALIGDAACAVHPLAGQGLNLGLKDVAALAETLVEAARVGEDLGSPAVLERYARRRRFDAATLAAATDGLRRVYGWQGAAARVVRAAGVSATGALGPVRRFLIREAGGAAGEAPRLLRGAAL